MSLSLTGTSLATAGYGLSLELPMLSSVPSLNFFFKIFVFFTFLFSSALDNEVSGFKPVLIYLVLLRIFSE